MSVFVFHSIIASLVPLGPIGAAQLGMIKVVGIRLAPRIGPVNKSNQLAADHWAWRGGAGRGGGRGQRGCWVTALCRVGP